MCLGLGTSGYIQRSIGAQCGMPPPHAWLRAGTMHPSRGQPLPAPLDGAASSYNASWSHACCHPCTKRASMHPTALRGNKPAPTPDDPPHECERGESCMRRGDKSRARFGETPAIRGLTGSPRDSSNALPVPAASMEVLMSMSV